MTLTVTIATFSDSTSCQPSKRVDSAMTCVAWLDEKTEMAPLLSRIVSISNLHSLGKLGERWYLILSNKPIRLTDELSDVVVVCEVELD
jgi:hypothetical protein